MDDSSQHLADSFSESDLAASVLVDSPESSW